MPLAPTNYGAPQYSAIGYGAASKYDFDNPNKWTTVTGVPVLDEHEMTDEAGRPVAYVDKNELQQIAVNNNKRVFETGDPAPLTIGHTSDNPQAPEKPVVGYAVNYRVKPYKQGRYAIHVDYKVRKKYEHAVDDFPRRSVELWWSKRELDPIALLGGTTPERDLGVIVRNARLKGVALLGSTTPQRDLGVTVRYDRKSKGTVFRYEMDEGPDQYSKVAGEEPEMFSERGNGKVGKVMGEYKHGSLHSGSKNGPKVTSRSQALAIAMSEAKKSKDKMARNDGGDCMPTNYGDPVKMKYALGDDDGAPTDDLPPDSDPDDSGIGGEGGDDGSQINDGGDGDFGGGDSSDPMLDKVFASKQWQQLQSQVEEILAALTGESGGGSPGMGGPPGGDMGGPPGGGMPPDDGMGAPGGAPPMGGPPPGPGGPGMPPSDDEAREFHGAPPVRFESTGFPGPGSSNIPTFGGGTKGSRYSRNGSKQMQATAKQASRNHSEDRVVRMQRTIEGLSRKLARSEAEKTIAALKDEGIIFGESPEEAMKNEREELEFLAVLGDQDRAYHLSRVRKLYKRKQSDPVNPAYPGMARYARNDDGTGAASPDSYEPKDAQEAVLFADLQAQKKMSVADAVKYMRQGQRR